MEKERGGGTPVRFVDVYCVVEGQTEEQFARKVLTPHLDSRGVRLHVELVGKPGGQKAGGLREYRKLRMDLILLMKSFPSPHAKFTTMIDLYGLDNLRDEFPGFQTLYRCLGAYEKVAHLEAALKEEIGDSRLVPYLQLHEFEALILSEPQGLIRVFPNDEDGCRRLQLLVRDLEPEFINDQKPPSKRIETEIPAYQHQKLLSVRVAASIGLDKLRGSCPHFGAWLTLLENLSQV
jgi:hypothetical protein